MRSRLPLPTPESMSDEQRAIHADVLRAVAVFGERTLVEIVGVIGYCALVAYTLNAFVRLA